MDSSDVQMKHVPLSLILSQGVASCLTFPAVSHSQEMRSICHCAVRHMVINWVFFFPSPPLPPDRLPHSQ